MKKTFLKLVSFACILMLALVPMTACVSPSGPTGGVDKTKTQLYVGNYNGGMGERWLAAYKDGFEELYKDVSFEEGKVGVEVITLNDKVTYAADSIYASMDRSSVNVYFSELVDYYKFVDDGLLLDITDAVTTDLDGEDESISDKLNATQKSYYEIDGKYYGLPHYRSFRGIVYDKDLFNKKSLYIREDDSVTGKATDTDLSAGPDGQKGTYDDGLPATYEEFFKWCDVLKDKGIDPIVWNGSYKEAYTEQLLDALFANIEGAKGGNAYYNIPEDSSPYSFKVVTGFDALGAPITKTENISRSNYKKVTHTLSNYYALEFLQKLVSGNYFYKLSNNGTFSHEEAHYDFLHSRFDVNKNPIAMMLEGTWWEEESADIFEGMSGYEGASRSERNFGFLPLPKPDKSYLGGSTLFDGNQSIVMVNANCDEVHAELAKKFIRYITTDANLQLFNELTGIGRDYDYTLTTAQYNKLSTFGQDIYNLVQSGNGIVYGYATTHSGYTWEKTHTYDKFASNYPIDEFIDGVTAQDLFKDIMDTNK